MNTFGRGSGIRYESEQKLYGLPLVSIAIGPSVGPGPNIKELYGRPRGIIAIGEFPVGVIAVGSISRGIFAFGGIGVGLLSFGGLSLGAFAFGGLALGGFAIGGLAIGLVAIGGATCGYYACGSAAAGAHCISETVRDPEAVGFFEKWLPWAPKNFPRR